MDKIFQSFRIWWKNNMSRESDKWFEEENDFINAHKTKARLHLERLGWSVLSTDNRIFFYGFRIQKGEHIHNVSLREALKMK